MVPNSGAGVVGGKLGKGRASGLIGLGRSGQFLGRYLGLSAPRCGRCAYFAVKVMSLATHVAPVLPSLRSDSTR